MIIKLSGGMGNQMFQYAFGKSVASYFNEALYLDISFLVNKKNNSKYTPRSYYLDIFNIELTDKQFITNPILKYTFSSFLKKRFNISIFDYFQERKFGFDSNVWLHKRGYYDGYWQSKRYFDKIHKLLKDEFTFKQPINKNSTDLVAEIKKENSVCLNVRRGDYVGHPLHDVCDIDYYLRAVSEIRVRVPYPKFFVFSDDINWCKKSLNLGSDFVFISHDMAHNCKDRKFDNYLQLMSICNHYIIPNSTFAWWAIWLNKNPGYVVIPNNWFNDKKMNTSDFYNNDWIRI